MKSFLLLLAAIIVVTSNALAQWPPIIGKPSYVISVTREGIPLGDITIELYPDIAPRHVANFDSLVSIQFFDGLLFHRVVPGFVIQGGDPNTRNGDSTTWGYGDPSQTTVPAEFSRLSHLRGVFSAARSQDPNSATSQFFICVGSPTQLDGRYSIYGHVLSGMDLVDTIVSTKIDTVQNASGGESYYPHQHIRMTIARTGLDESIPGQPGLLWPADGAQRLRDTATLRWSPAGGAILYELQVSDKPDFSTVAVDTLLPAEPFKITALKRGMATYYWRVRASNGGRRGEFSETRSFTSGIAIPQPISPINKSTGIPVGTTITWNRVNGALTYRLEVSTSSTLSSPLVNRSDLTDTTFTISGLETSKRYYWRVRAADETGATPTSPIWYFTTSAFGSVEEGGSSQGISLTVAEERADRITLQATLPQRAMVSLVLADATGGEVASVAPAAMEEGSHLISIDLRGIGSGFYLCRLQAGGTIITRSIVVVR